MRIEGGKGPGNSRLNDHLKDDYERKNLGYRKRKRKKKMFRR